MSGRLLHWVMGAVLASVLLLVGCATNRPADVSNGPEDQPVSFWTRHQIYTDSGVEYYRTREGMLKAQRRKVSGTNQPTSAPQ